MKRPKTPIGGAIVFVTLLAVSYVTQVEAGSGRIRVIDDGGTNIGELDLTVQLT